MLLAIDTSSGTSVAVVRGERVGGRRVLSEATELDTMKHAEVIGLLIERALAEAGVVVSELTGVVAGMGPGPFTGLRVGIAAARAFALGADVPLRSVVSHDALAFSQAQAGVTGDLLVVTDARRREVYWSLYRLAANQGAPVRVDGPGLAKPDALPHPHALALEAAEDSSRVSAGSLGLVALELLTSGGEFAGDQALYLRSPDVTLSAGAKRVTQ
ncbi:tRNA (adenosine(37)-N6)-threonylcarbamoyltransferase complex dimerization subunit type 1 TsaB [Subtercola vilae]|uniref:tRNA (Adenosine(37)-N6)-threonylcarbamoyltransferase complex dimerization subunit type 1 TsaB n=1 Tax=Subtercola vilae TaxID=2056433 RepID=A0A4T2C552_9MICO|nr:tRNA (adenosine(37)-N6)-threonylcarbamoyltransferase complex dimerization subunit type 1 TsaB [Subtercola vilae]